MRASRHVFVLTAALVTAVTLSGCGGGSTSASDPTVSASTSATPTSTAHASTARLAAKNIVLDMAEAMVDARTLTMTTRTTTNGKTATSVVDVDMKNSAVRVNLPGTKGRTEVWSVDGQTYVKVPATKGKFFIVAPTDTSYADVVHAADPVGPVRALYDAVVSATPSGGPVTMDGVAVQAYDIAIDTTKVTDGLGGLVNGVPAEQLPPTVTFTYWVDGENRAHRATSNASGVPVEIDYSNWGVDPSIAAPAADDLTQAPA
jgi:hypothetical protein